MSGMPGCPPRKVNRIDDAPGGANLQLACGHWLFIAGFSHQDRDNVVRFNTYHRCQSSPCYQHGPDMGTPE
jgi:hypothetical protein